VIGVLAAPVSLLSLCYRCGFVEDFLTDWLPEFIKNHDLLLLVWYSALLNVLVLFLLGLAITAVIDRTGRKRHMIEMIGRCFQALPMVFATLHILMCLVMASTWVAAYREYGAVVVSDFNESYPFFRVLDFPVSWLALQVALWAAGAQSLELVSDSSVPTLMCTAGPLLLVLGTVQWFLVGHLLRWARIRYERRAGVVHMVHSVVLLLLMILVVTLILFLWSLI